jgi:hypothetical protein
METHLKKHYFQKAGDARETGTAFAQTFMFQVMYVNCALIGHYSKSDIMGTSDGFIFFYVKTLDIVTQLIRKVGFAVGFRLIEVQKFLKMDY